MSKVILPEPTPELKQLSLQLCALIREELAQNGFMSFSRYMEMALYQPGLGYYSAGLHKLGAAGDFVTAPELGSLFAGCLARQVEQVGHELGHYDVLELGAGSGRMAVDLLLQMDPAVAPQNYFILERSADLRAVQQQTLAQRLPHWLGKVHWLDAPPVEPWQGVLLANEVIDALAVERFRLGQEGIEQAGIRLAGNDSAERPRFEWCYRPAEEPLLSAVTRLQLSPDQPYQSEILPELNSWLDAVCGKLSCGVALFIDYGYPRHEYYSPERRDGTLMCNYRHRAHSDVFFWPGLQDITAFIDFTALAEAGEGCGMELAGYTSQSLFLLACGLDELLSQGVGSAGDQGLSLSAEAKQLTLPGMMGERFQVMALTRNLSRNLGRNLNNNLQTGLRGFELRDLSYRL
jgi:SAM-dependent MidA family methyltransferase